MSSATLARPRTARQAVVSGDGMVEPDKLYHRHRVTPYAGTTLSGRVRTVWCRGGESSGMAS